MLRMKLHVRVLKGRLSSGFQADYEKKTGEKNCTLNFYDQDARIPNGNVPVAKSRITHEKL